MKYKRKKMWKSWILFGFIFAMFFLIPTGYAYLKTRDVKTEKDIITDEMKLKNIGYSLNDISIIIKNKNIKKYALKNEYDSELMDYVNTKGFDINNLSKYKEYKKNACKGEIQKQDFVWGYLIRILNEEKEAGLISILRKEMKK